METRTDAARAKPAALAYPLLTLTTLMWAGNAVAGKWATGEVSPQVLTTLRWAIGFAVLALIAPRQSAEDWRLLARRPVYLFVMGASGFTAYASLFYLAGTHTSATNVALFQGSIPVLVMLMNFWVSRTAVSGGQAIGAAITLMGAGVAATHGDWSVLRTLSFNLGDGLMLVACLFYAGYTVGLAARPKVAGLAFFTAIAATALITSLPPLAVEWAAGHLIWPTAKGWAIVAFVAIGPTLFAQLFFIRGVELIGPNRAGLFVNLVPIFGAGLAVWLAAEPFGWSQALALALVLGGIAIAERFKAVRPVPRPA